MLGELHDAIAEAVPDAEIRDFKCASALLKELAAKEKLPDVVFSDIELPGINGLSLAVKVKNAAPEARIIFVTGYPQYALEAYRRHVNGYLLKPVDAEMVRKELDAQRLPIHEPEPGKLEVRCFGPFEVFWHGEPVIFERKQSKELLAFLIDRRGSACTAEEIAAALWEDEGNMTAAKTRIRTILRDLKTTLEKIGMENLLIRERRQLAIRRELVDCDYYRMLDGEIDAINAYHGQYMPEYSWAEPTAGYLFFNRKKT